ncbi:MAG: DMT family transporter [Candidatus Hodarchaeota archaeon]
MQIIQNEKQKAFFFLLNANLIWGITPIFLEVILKYFSPLQAVTLRFGIAAVTLSFILYISRGRKAFSFLFMKNVIILGWLDALGYLAATVGQDMSTAGLATLLSSFYVFIVPFIAWRLEDAEINMKLVFTGSISLIGVFLISFNGDWTNLTKSSMFGVLILIFSAIMWGFYTVLTGNFLKLSKLKDEKVDLLNFTSASIFHTFLVLSFISFVVAEPIIIFPLEIIPIILFLGLVPTIFALSLWNWAIARLGAVDTSFIQLLQLVVPFILEFILFQQSYTVWIYSGISLILISSVWMTEGALSSNKSRKNKPDKLLTLESMSSKITNANLNSCCS